MARFFLVRAALLFLLLPAVVSAAALDDYYLSEFGEKAHAAKALSAVVQQTGQAERCRTHLYRSLKRDFSALEPATQKVLAKYAARPVLSGQTSATSAPFYNSPGGHFSIHYTPTGLDAPDDLTDADADSVPDWVETVAAVFEQVYSAEVTGMGYNAPPVVRYDVYLRNLVPELAYGFTVDEGAPTSGVSVGSYIEIDRSFTDPRFTVNGKYTALDMLKVTAAHEFHHAIQFGYNYYFDFWYAEVTATWMEDEVFDSVNQLYSYLPEYLPLAGSIALDAPLTGNNSEYGRWIFNRYLAEKHGTVQVVRSAWERLATLHPSTSPTTSNGDIQMPPVLDATLSATYSSTLSTDFFGFAKRAYTRDWTSRAASETNLIPVHAVKASYSSYPVTSASVAAPSVVLPRYSYVYYKFSPSTSMPTLTISVTKTTGIQTALFTKSGGVVSEVTANTGGLSYSVTGFDAMNSATDEVVLLVANTTGVDGHQANFSTDGSTPAPQEPVVGSSGGSSGGGCFIATAAYGSYLHPKVAELRSFRDHYLMTNAPGRLFVTLYYRISPPVANVIAQHEWLKGGVRMLLLPLVLAVEYPAGALLLLLLAAGVVVSRLARRRKAIRVTAVHC